MIISLIAAMGKNKVIGRNNSLPWNLPRELRMFKALTKEKAIIMGRKTFESIGRPLPRRRNIILTHDTGFKADGCIVVYSIDEALKAANTEEIMIIGGGHIYKEFLPRADRMYLSLIDAEFEGDTFFPEYDEDEWKVMKKERFEADKENKYGYTFLVLERRH